MKDRAKLCPRRRGAPAQSASLQRAGISASIDGPCTSPTAETARYRRNACRQTIESVLQENRVFPPADGVRQAGQHLRHGRLPEAVRRGRARFRRVLGAARAGARAVAQAVHARCSTRANAPFFKWFDDGELNASYNCLDRHLQEPARQDRDHLRGRRRQGDEDHLPGAPPPRLHVRERAEVARHQERRPRHRLHADVDRGRGRDAGVRAHRRHPLGRVRRLLRQEPAGAHHRRRRGRGAHRRRAVPRRARDPAQGRGRRGARDGRLRVDQEGRRLQAHRQQRRRGTRSATSGCTTW